MLIAKNYLEKKQTICFYIKEDDYRNKLEIIEKPEYRILYAWKKEI